MTAVDVILTAEQRGGLIEQGGRNGRKIAGQAVDLLVNVRFHQMKNAAFRELIRLGCHTQNGDSAGCVVVAPPAVPGGKFRILERHQWRGMDFRAQADAIKKLTEQYNVTYIGIDSTGVGHGVYENVKAFFPAVREFVYNPNVKNALVLKAYDIISHRRLEFDAGHTDIAQSFMAIRRATTASGNRPTYEASRSEEASHADLAWATMHALFNEPLQGESANTSNIVEIF